MDMGQLLFLLNNFQWPIRQTAAKMDYAKFECISCERKPLVGIYIWTSFFGFMEFLQLIVESSSVLSHLLLFITCLVDDSQSYLAVLRSFRRSFWSSIDPQSDFTPNLSECHEHQAPTTRYVDLAVNMVFRA